jgi:hypothetical protein
MYPFCIRLLACHALFQAKKPQPGPHGTAEEPLSRDQRAQSSAIPYPAP